MHRYFPQILCFHRRTGKQVLPQRSKGKENKSNKSTTALEGKITSNAIWDKVFKNGSSKICGRQLLKNLKGYGLLKHSILD